IGFGNGLEVIARPNGAARSIAVQLVLEAGAAFDPAEKEGTAALVASLLDRGAGSLSAAAIAGFFDDLGVAYAAEAHRDTLATRLRLLSEPLPGDLERPRLIRPAPTLDGT